MSQRGRKMNSKTPKNNPKGRKSDHVAEVEMMDTSTEDTKEHQHTGTQNSFNNEGMHTDYQYQYDLYQNRAQAQTQQQLQRSIEASKQMLYGVYGNVITILEELEKRELAEYRMEHNMPKSDIYIPDQRHKTNEDIRSNVQTQLLLFETQTKACLPEALAEVNEELRRKTLSWSAIRAENDIKEIQQTDFYLSKLYEILAKGETHHQTNERKEVTEEVMREGFQAVIHGDHDRAEIDRKFKQHPDEKATAPNTRGSESLLDGAKRIARAHGDNKLDSHLKNDVDKFEGDGPNDLK